MGGVSPCLAARPHAESLHPVLPVWASHASGGNHLWTRHSHRCAVATHSSRPRGVCGVSDCVVWCCVVRGALGLRGVWGCFVLRGWVGG